MLSRESFLKAAEVILRKGFGCPDFRLNITRSGKLSGLSIPLGTLTSEGNHYKYYLFGFQLEGYQDIKEHEPTT